MRSFFRLLVVLLVSIGVPWAGAAEYFQFEAHIGPGARSATVHGYLFDEEHESIRVLDRGPLGPQAHSLGSAFSAVGALAGCNGAILRVSGEPTGLVIAEGKKIGILRAGDPSVGAMLVVRGEKIVVRSAVDMQEMDLANATQALQGGPLLVTDGQTVEGLDTKIFGRRTVIVTNGQGRWAILYIPSATLDGAAKMLGDGKTFPKFKITAAMNLDGGLTSSLWVQRSDKALPIYLKEVNPVRVAIAIFAR